MPKMSKSGKPKKSELPSTLQKSAPKAQRTFVQTHDAAVEQYGEGERANRTAYASLKHSFEKVGDHWEAKEEKGPSDPRSKGGREQGGRSYGGVDANASKKHLYELAKRLQITGRSTMTKPQLAEAIDKANQHETRKVR